MTNGDEGLDRGPHWSGRFLAVTTVVLAVAFLAAGSWASYHAPLRNDQYQLIQLGQCVRNGGRFYVDCWENKPPGIAWINALGLVLSGGDPVGPWLLPGVTAAAALAAVWVAATRMFSVRTGRRVVLIGALVYALRIYDAPSINPDFYASVFELAAIALWLLGFTGGEAVGPRPRIRAICLVGGGLLWSAATAFKQVGGVGLAALTIVGFALAAMRHAEGKRWLKGVAAAWVGFAIGVGTVTAVLAYQRTLGEAWASIVTFNTELANWKAFSAAFSFGGRVRADLAPLSPFLWLSLLGIVVTLYFGRANQISRPWTIAMILWWFAAVAFALLGPSGSMRYWQATFPPMVWLAGAGVYHVQQAQERLEPAQRLTFIAVTVTALVVLMRPTLYEARAGLASSYVESVEHPNERERLVEAGRRIHELVPSGERIYVWGYHAGVYVYADRSAASRFTYPRSTSQMVEILNDMERGKARLLLIPKHRAPEFERFCDEACHQRLEGILRSYKPLDPMGPYEVWTRAADGIGDATPSSP